MMKEQILSEIRRLADENGGVAPGSRTFAEETGILIGKWRGKFWRNWSEALVEAGFPPNLPKVPHQREVLLLALVRLTRTLARFPTYADMRLARESDKSFPAHQVFDKLGNREERIEFVREYARAHEEYKDVLNLQPEADTSSLVDGDNGETPRVDGHVYLLKLGKHYKIGHTTSVPTRHRQINLELPEKTISVHTIATDDPAGIETYWHTRFSAKRTNGEWFLLSREDIQAFKRRKFM